MITANLIIVLMKYVFRLRFFVVKKVAKILRHPKTAPPAIPIDTCLSLKMNIIKTAIITVSIIIIFLEIFELHSVAMATSPPTKVGGYIFVCLVCNFLFL